MENFNLRFVAWKFQSRSEILNFFNLWALWETLPFARIGSEKWGVAKESSVSWVAKFKGDIKLQNASCQIWVVAELQGDNLLLSAGGKVSGREVTGWQINIPVSHAELYDPWISGPFRVSRFLKKLEDPEGPRIEKNPISRGNIEKNKLSIRNENFNREGNFHTGPLSGRRKTGPGIDIFNREWKFQTENENFKREWKFRAWGNDISCVRARMNCFDSRALWG